MSVNKLPRYMYSRKISSGAQFRCHVRKIMLNAIAIQQTATHGLFLSPILAHFQNMPSKLKIMESWVGHGWSNAVPQGQEFILELSVLCLWEHNNGCDLGFMVSNLIGLLCILVCILWGMTVMLAMLKSWSTTPRCSHSHNKKEWAWLTRLHYN